MYEKMFFQVPNLCWTTVLLPNLVSCCPQEEVRVITTAQTRSIRKAAEYQGYSIKHVAIREGTNYSAKPAQSVLTKRIRADVETEIRAGLQK